MNEIKLLPCPFCGSTKLKIDKKSRLYGHITQGIVEQHTFSVRCNVCHARGGAIGGRTIDIRQSNEKLPEWIVTDKELKEKAIELWNTRKPMQEIVERLEEIKKIMLSPKNVDCFGEPCTENDCMACVINKAIEIVKEVGGMND